MSMGFDFLNSKIEDNKLLHKGLMRLVGMMDVKKSNAVPDTEARLNDISIINNDAEE